MVITFASILGAFFALIILEAITQRIKDTFYRIQMNRRMRRYSHEYDYLNADHTEAGDFCKWCGQMEPHVCKERI